MRLRASQVAKTRLVETEEDVETYRPVLDAIKTAIGDRQAELARLEGELSADATDGTLDGLVHYRLHLYGKNVAIVVGKTVHEDDELSVSVHWSDTPRLVMGEAEGTGGGSVFYLPHIKSFIISNLHMRVGVGRGRNGGDNPLT